MVVKRQCMYMSLAPGTEKHRIRQRFFFSFPVSFCVVVVRFIENIIAQLLLLSHFSRVRLCGTP